MKHALIFRIANYRFAISTDQVVRVEMAAAFEALAESNPSVYGLLNYHGETFPIVHLRSRLKLPFKELNPDDMLIIIQKGGVRLALAVDQLEKIADMERDDCFREQWLDYDELEIRLLTWNERDAAVIYEFDYDKMLTTEIPSIIASQTTQSEPPTQP